MEIDGINIFVCMYHWCLFLLDYHATCCYFKIQILYWHMAYLSISTHQLKTILKDNTTKDTSSCNDIFKTKISKNNNIVISRSVTSKYALTLRIHPTYKQVYQEHIMHKPPPLTLISNLSCFTLFTHIVSRCHCFSCIMKP